MLVQDFLQKTRDRFLFNSTAYENSKDMKNFLFYLDKKKKTSSSLTLLNRLAVPKKLTELMVETHS